MKPGARICAILDILPIVLGDTRTPADKQISDWFRANRYAGSKDRNAIAGDVYGILRTLAQLDWWVKRTHACPVVDWDTPPHDHTPLNRARVIVHKILTEKLPQTALETDLFTGEKYAPEPLTSTEKRMIVELENQSLSTPCQPVHVRGNFPEFLADELLETYGDSTLPLANAMMAEAPVDIRVNTLIANPEQVTQSLRDLNIQTTPCPMVPNGLRMQKRHPLSNTDGFRQGWFEIQDEGSQIIANLVGAKPKHRVVDFCAGAGGKTLALAGYMQNKGRIVACDVSENRLKRAGQRIKRAKAFTIERRTLSSERDKWVKRQAVGNGVSEHALESGSGSGFDRVLVDAPCSGTGTWRRNPDHKWRLSPQDIDELVVLQQSILQSSARLVKPGGRLVYATCSILPRENQQQVETFLQQFSNFFLVPIPQVWEQENPTPCPVNTDTLQLTPHAHGTDGFFVAVLERKLV